MPSIKGGGGRGVKAPRGWWRVNGFSNMMMLSSRMIGDGKWGCREALQIYVFFTNKTRDQHLGVSPKNTFCLPHFGIFFFFYLFHVKKWKKPISTRVWHSPHSNTCRNIKHLHILSCLDRLPQLADKNILQANHSSCLGSYHQIVRNRQISLS